MFYVKKMDLSHKTDIRSPMTICRSFFFFTLVVIRIHKIYFDKLSPSFYKSLKERN